MSLPEQGAPPSSGEEARSKLKAPTKPSAGSRWTASYLWAGILIIVVIGGIAFSSSLSALTATCAGDPAMPPLAGLPSCGNLLVSGAADGAIAAIAIGFGVLLFARAHVAPSRRLPLAAGIFVALVLIVAGIPAAVTPPAATIGTPPQLPFPIPVGTTFNATPGEFGAFAEAQIPVDPYAPYAPIELQGGWNSTASVCFEVNRAAGPDLGPGVGLACGTSVTFVFDLGAATYVFAFYLPLEGSTVLRAQVVITHEVQIVY